MNTICKLKRFPAPRISSLILSGLASGRAFGYQNLLACFELPRLDSCLMVTKRDIILKKEVSRKVGHLPSAVGKPLSTPACMHGCLTSHTGVGFRGHGCQMVMMMMMNTICTQ